MAKYLWLLIAFAELVGLYYLCHVHISDASNTSNVNYQGQLFANSCECQSMFTINLCDKKISGNEKIAEKLIVIKQNLKRLHRGRHLKGHDIYSILSRFLPLSYKMQTKATETNPFFERESRDNRSFWHKFYQDMHHRVPYVSCKEYDYSTAEVKKCIDQFNAIAGRELKIAFVGDSTVRGFMEALVRDNDKEFKFQFRDSNLSLDVREKFLNNGIKFNLPIVGAGLQLKFYWAPFLEENTSISTPQFQGAKDVIQKWVYDTNGEDLPDVVYLSVGLWNAVQMHPVEAITSHYNSLNDMFWLINELALKTKVLFLATPPVKEWLLFGNRPNPQNVLDFINQIKFLKFYNSNVWMWDSLYPVAIRDNYECKYYFHLKKLFNIHTPDDWACSDFMHFGSKTEKSGNNQVWNFICNKLMKKGKDACCS